LTLSNPSRRGVISATGALIAAPHVLRAAESKPEYVTTLTALGTLRGVRSHGVDLYRGVAYGGDVSGLRRFLPAAPVAPWHGVRDALTFGAPSVQPAGGLYGIGEPPPDENCLYLNVWAPADAGSKRPVMFYSHGGGFTTGSAAAPSQDASNLAREYDVVVVASNHRLGLFGYLYLGELGGPMYDRSGNQGMWDLRLALKWVRDNITAFGGDPDNVMLFGESGGGAKTSCLYAMPSAAPIFAKAAIQSGPATRIGLAETAADTTRQVLGAMGLKPSDWKTLLSAPAGDILKAQLSVGAQYHPKPGGWLGIADFGPGGYGPILDAELLPHHPFDPAAPASARDKPLITGWIDSEATFFAWTAHDAAAFNLDEDQLRARLQPELGAAYDGLIAAYRKDRPGATPSDLYLAIQSARIMGLGTLAIAERKAAQHAAPVYYYNLAYRSNFRLPGLNSTGRGVEAGAMHAIDIALVFDNPNGAVLLGDRPERVQAARHMSQFWTSFARTSRPAADGQPVWRPYTAADRATLVIDADCQLVVDRYRAERLAWETLTPVV
jgi:para-nitrobenzyl esterase